MITVGECGLKAQSKSEMYRLLATEGRVYLPPLKEANYLYIKDLMTGKKKASLFHHNLV
jgi:hypothetical protein